MTTRVYVVTRKGYVFLLDREADLVVCGEAESAEDALSGLRDTPANVVVADLRMDGMSGIELVKRIGDEHGELPVLIVSMHDEALYAERALAADARGYLMKNEAGPRVVDAIRQLARGGMYFSERMNAQLLTGRRGGGPASVIASLSDCELEALEHLGQGLTTAQMAEAMAISPNTVESYQARLKAKLGLSSGAELTRFAMEHAMQRGL